MKNDQYIKMDKGNFEAETHKFIIPDLRQRTQPGLEVHHYAEQEASSPEVVAPPSSTFGGTLGTPLEAQRSYDAGQEAPRASTTSPSLPERAYGGHDGSRSPPQLSSLPERTSEDSQIRLRSLTDATVSPRLQLMKIEEPPAPEEKKQKYILGLPALRFWILIIVATLLTNAIAVGVAVGVTRNNKKGAGSVTYVGSPTPTGQGVQGVPSPAPINQYCPNGNDTEIIPYDASGTPIVFNQEQSMKFRMLCNTYWPAKGRNQFLRDIMVVYTPDMYTCIGLCAAYNSGYSDAVGDDVFLDGGGICVAVALVKGPAQFCHLQNATGINDTSAAYGNPVDTAVLVGDWIDMTSDNQTVAFGGNLPEEGDEDE